MIQKILISLGCVIVGYGLVFILQIWTGFLGAEVFLKLSLTVAAIVGVQLLVVGVLYAIKENKELKDGDFLG